MYKFFNILKYFENHNDNIVPVPPRPVSPVFLDGLADIKETSRVAHKVNVLVEEQQARRFEYLNLPRPSVTKTKKRELEPKTKKETRRIPLIENENQQPVQETKRAKFKQNECEIRVYNLFPQKNSKQVSFTQFDKTTVAHILSTANIFKGCSFFDSKAKLSLATVLRRVFTFGKLKNFFGDKKED